MNIKKLKYIYVFVLFIFILNAIGIYYIDDVVSWYYKDVEIPKYRTMPYEFWNKYGTWPLKYYYLKFARVIIYSLWLLSVYFIYKKIKIKIWVINIVYPIVIFLSCLLFSMLTLIGGRAI